MFKRSSKSTLSLGRSGSSKSTGKYGPGVSKTDSKQSPSKKIQELFKKHGKNGAEERGADDASLNDSFDLVDETDVWTTDNSVECVLGAI
jgi:hypothetical protein